MLSFICLSSGKSKTNIILNIQLYELDYYRTLYKKPVEIELLHFGNFWVYFVGV